MWKKIFYFLFLIYPWAYIHAYFFEQDIYIPEGISELHTDKFFTASTFIFKNNKHTPEIFYENEKGDFLPWALDNDEDEEYENHKKSEQKNLVLLLSGYKKNTLKIKSAEGVWVRAQFFNTKKSEENLVVFDPFDEDMMTNDDNPILRLMSKLEINIPRYISRAEWGADETLRIAKSDIYAKVFTKWFEQEAKKIPPKFQPTIIADKNEAGEPLFWPIAKNKCIAKFIIHHTGEVRHTAGKRDPKEIMRAIYYYHTKTKGWGDIGYNYVIDKHGNIYEGRAGGPDIVGAHVMFHNIGTIGVSLMGNFNLEEPTEAQLKVLSLLLADHARRFHVNPIGQTFYLGTKTYNITGHRQVARKDHGTACPGTNLINKLDAIRKAVVQIIDVLDKKEKNDIPLGIDFLSKSKIAPKIQKFKTVEFKKNLPPIELSELITKKVLSRSKKEALTLTATNNTKFVWPPKSKIMVKNAPDGLIMTPFRSQEELQPGAKGVFRAWVLPKKTPNGNYFLHLEPEFLKGKIFDEVLEKISFEYPIQISGEKTVFYNNSTKKNYFKNSIASLIKPQINEKKISPADLLFEKKVKVKLKFFKEKYVDLVSDTEIEFLNERDRIIQIIPAKTNIRVFSKQEDKNNFLTVKIEEKEWALESTKFRTTGIIEIKNYNRNISSSIPYNKFRRQINIYPNSKQELVVINELPIEEYLWGLAEEPSSEPDQKKHAIHVLARSYAFVYSGKRRKFHTKLYDLEDDPATSQFYLGYDWERYHASQKELVKMTEGEVIICDDKPIIGPYFTQSSGESSDKWQSQYPWTKKQKLPCDEGLEQKGHGVGLSGNSARCLAKEGKKYQEILDYFFDGIDVKKIY